MPSFSSLWGIHLAWRTFWCACPGSWPLSISVSLWGQVYLLVWVHPCLFLLGPMNVSSILVCTPNTVFCLFESYTKLISFHSVQTVKNMTIEVISPSGEEWFSCHPTASSPMRLVSFFLCWCSGAVVIHNLLWFSLHANHGSGIGHDSIVILNRPILLVFALFVRWYQGRCWGLGVIQNRYLLSYDQINSDLSIILYILGTPATYFLRHTNVLPTDWNFSLFCRIFPVPTTVSVDDISHGGRLLSL